MKIIPRAEALPDLESMEAAHFTGKAGSHALLAASAPPLSTSAALVRFETGVRNYWHAHAGGQLLYVIEGEGWVRPGGPTLDEFVSGTRPQPTRMRNTGMVRAGVALSPILWLTSARRAGWRSRLLHRIRRPASCYSAARSMLRALCSGAVSRTTDRYAPPAGKSLRV